MSTENAAKKRLPLNIVTNYLAIGTIAVINFFITPFLINSLGTQLYGIIPLFYSINQYFMLLTGSISSSITRYIGVSYGQDEELTTVYYSTSFAALIGAAVVIMSVVVLMSFQIEHIFNIPSGCEYQSAVLFVMIMLASLIGSISSPFKVSAFLKHRFDIDNIIKVMGWGLHFGLLYFLFEWFSPGLINVGFAYIAMSALILISCFFMAQKLTPDLKIRLDHIRWNAFKEISKMGIWSFIDELGTLLFFSIDMAVVNICLGTVSGGQYAPVVQWGMLMSTLGGAVSGLFTPIVYTYVGQKNLDLLTKNTFRCMKYMGLLMAFPVGIVCGLGEQILNVWIGVEFGHLSIVLVTLVFPQVLYLSVAPLYAVNRGMNKVKIPATLTLIGGVVNCGFSIYVACFTSLGIWGVALVTSLCLCFRSIIFTCGYSSKILNKPFHLFIKSTIWGITNCVIIVAFSRVLANYWHIDSYLKLMAAAIIVCLPCVLIQYLFFLNQDDRDFLLSFFRRKQGP